MRHHRSLLLLSAVFAAGCGGSEGNPFAALSLTEVPDDGADLIFVSNLHDPSLPLREVFALDIDGSGEPQQITFCTTEERLCDALGASLAPDRLRLAVRRIDGDFDRDGDLDTDDGVALYVVDLERGLDTQFVDLQGRVSGVDWSPTSDLLVYSARTPLAQQGILGAGGDDLYRISGTRQSQFNLTESPPILERNPRINPSGTIAVYERTDPVGDPDDLVELVADPFGASEVWVFQSSLNQLQVTVAPDPPGPRLPRTPYLVGSSADPVFSPEESRVAYRRLTGIGDARGTWDLFAEDIDTGTETVLAEGGAYRSGPDWNERGVVWAESDADSTRLLLVEPETGALQVLLTLPPEVRIEVPRWLFPRPETAAAAR